MGTEPWPICEVRSQLSGPRTTSFHLAFSAGDSLLESVILWTSLGGLALIVLAETAIRNFRWSKLEEVVSGREELVRIQALLKKERIILDGLIALRTITTFLVLLAIMGFFSENTGLGPSVDFAGFAKDLFITLLVFLGGLYGVVRGIARAIPERTLIVVLWPSFLIGRALSPLVWLTDAIGRVTCRALGLPRTVGSEEARHEILDAVTVGERGGAINDEGREMIENIIEVQRRDVKEVMTPRTSVYAIPIDTPLEDAIRAVVEQGHSRVPVFQGTIDNVQGILYTKDLLNHWGQRQKPLPPLKDVLRHALFVPETKKANDLLNELRRDRVHMAIVLDEYGGMSGIITIEDLLEEIVGEIRDEYDAKDQGQDSTVMRLTDNEAEVAGVVHIDDLNSALDLTLPEDESYDTVGGFISSRLGRVPGTGETCDFENVRFEILDADARRIHRVKVVVAET